MTVFREKYTTNQNPNEQTPISTTTQAFYIRAVGAR